jgi:hypothetical protein
MDQETSWVSFPQNKKIRIYGFSKADRYLAEKDTSSDMLQALHTVDANLAIDSADNGTSLLLTHELSQYLLRKCALPSLYESAKISGSALGKMSPEALADTLNLCFPVSTDGSLACIRAGKCAAVLSDGYLVMNTKDVFETAVRNVKARLGKMEFRAGYNSHSYSSITYDLPEFQEQFIKLYQNALVSGSGSVGYRGVSFMPGVRICTSDTGFCAATVIPTFRTLSPKGYPVNMSLCNPIKVEHRKRGHESECGMDAFQNATESIFGKFNDTIEMVEKMAKTAIFYPMNVIDSLGRKIGLPKKYIIEAKTSHEALGTGCCTMHDVFLSFYDGFADVENEKARLDLEEKVLRILTMDWKYYDTAYVM